MSYVGPEPCELSMPHCTPSELPATACKGTFISTYIYRCSKPQKRKAKRKMSDWLLNLLLTVGCCGYVWFYFFFLFKIGQDIPKTFVMLSWPVKAWEGNTNQWIIVVYLRTLTQLVIPLGNILNFCQCLYWYRASAEIIEGSLCVKLALCNSAWEQGKGPGSCFSEVSPEVRYKT